MKVLEDSQGNEYIFDDDDNFIEKRCVERKDRCPDCKTLLYDLEANFCTSCRRDLRPLQSECSSCGGRLHLWPIPEEERGNYCPWCAAPNSWLSPSEISSREGRV